MVSDTGYTTWDGKWAYGDDEPISVTDAWQWTIHGKTNETYNSPSGFFTKNELPSGIWEHDIKDYNGKYSWQVEGSHDYFNSYELITFTNGGEPIFNEITNTNISNLYKLNYFKYSPGIWDFTDLFRSNFEAFTIFTCHGDDFIPYCIVKSFWCRPCT